MTGHRLLNRPHDSRFCNGVLTIAIGLFSLIVIASVTSVETAACDIGVQHEDSSAAASCAMTASLDSGISSGDSVDESMSTIPMTAILSVASGLFTLLVLLGFVELSRARAKTGPACASGQDRKETGHLPLLEKRSVSARFLVICPFCGSKNDEVESSCNDCGAEF